jgi:hypothetical protein
MDRTWERPPQVVRLPRIVPQSRLAAQAGPPVGKNTLKLAGANKADPGRQIVFAVEGLTCPAVKGLG